MNKVFSAVNQSGISILSDETGDDVKILEDGWAHFRHVSTEALDLENGNISNVGLINNLQLPTSRFLGVNDPIVKLGVQTQVLDMGTNNIINAGTVSATDLYGSIRTPTQPFITSLGTQAAAFKMGGFNIQNAGDIATTTLQAGNLTVAGNTVSALAGTGHINFSKNIDMSSNSLLNVTNINGNAVPANALVDVSSAQNITNKTIGNMLFGTNTITGANNVNLTISAQGSGVVKFSSDVNMMTNNLVSVGNINGLTIPANALVDISSPQTLTGKTINASQLVDSTVSLAKMSSLAANSIIGNNTGSAATPLALTTAQVKTMLELTGINSGDQTITLTGDITGSGASSFTTTIGNSRVTLPKIANIPSLTLLGNNTIEAAAPSALTATQVKTVLSLNNVQNVALSTWSGSSNLTVLGTLNNLNVGFLNMTLGTLSSTGANSDLTITGAGTGVINALKTIKLSNGLSSTGTLSIIPNGGLSPVEIWGPLDMKTNDISNVNIFTCSGSMSNGGTYSNFVTSRSTNSNLTLNANGTGIVVTNNSSFWVSSTVSNVDSLIAINGPTVGNSRYVGCFQNGTYKLSFGLAASSHFFIYDGVNARDLFQASILNANIRFPTYTTNGTLSFTGGNGTISSSSDRRLKMGEELLNKQESLEKIMNLQPKKFKWVSTPDVQNIGFVAQDVETIIPEAVDGKKFEYEFFRDNSSQGNEGVVRVDGNGDPVLDQTKPRYRGLDQCAILSTLVSAVQALTEKNNTLEAKLTNLQTQLGIQL